MKKHLQKISLLAILLCIHLSPAYCQLNPATNSFTPLVKDTINSKSGNTPNVTDGTTGFTCPANTFWGQAGGVVALTLTGGVVTEGATVVPNSVSIAFGLAYCNNLSGGPYSPTFYTAGVDSHHAAWYNGTDWTTDPARTSFLIVNAGGNGSYLYYTALDTANSINHAVLRYNGNTFSTAHTWDTSQVITVADISVDDYGNAWVFTGPHTGALATDSVNVISPYGQLIHQYPFNFDTYNAYGAILLHDTIYIALGSFNTTHPNTLIPVILANGDSIVAGTPIAFNYGFGDLASCNAGSPLAVKEFTGNSSVSIFPNPADDEITLAGISITKGRSDLKIYDLLGKEIFSGQLNVPEYKLQTSNFNNGIYIVELRNGNQSITQKILVQH